MTLLSLLIVLAILVLVITVICRPFFNTESDVPVDHGQSMEITYGEYHLTLNRIRELKMELQEGKITEEDYAIQWDELKKKAAVLLMKLSSHEHLKSKVK